MLGDLDPAVLQRLLVEVATEEADRYKAALQDALDEGWLLWSLNSPDLRFRGYMSNTIVEDLPLVLEPAYYDLYKQKMAPDLIALQLWNTAQQNSQLTGQPIADTSKLLWGMLLVLPRFIFLHFQSDFISLSKNFINKQGAASGSPMPAMQPASQLPPEDSGQGEPAIATAG